MCPTGASGGKWKRLGNVTTNRFGMFERTFRARPTGRVRARLGSEDATLPFSPQIVPDRFFNRFGLLSFEPETMARAYLRRVHGVAVRARPPVGWGSSR